MTFPDYARLGALEALHLHSAAAMLQATLENPPQSPPSPPTFAIDTPMSLSWALQALDLSKKNITIFTYSSWGQERKLNLSYNPQLELISSWYQDSFLLEELFLAGIKNGKASLLASLKNSAPHKLQALNTLDLSEGPLNASSFELLQSLPSYFPNLQRLALRNRGLQEPAFYELLQHKSIKLLDVSDNLLKDLDIQALNTWASSRNLLPTLTLMRQNDLLKQLASPLSWLTTQGTATVFLPHVKEGLPCIIDLRKNPLSPATRDSFTKNYSSYPLSEETLVYYNIPQLLFLLVDAFAPLC